jgi:hypothetical protein
VRRATTSEERWAWWEAAVEGGTPPVHGEDPQQGYYCVRKFPYGEWPKGPFVPARIWWTPGEIDPETGELMSDETCHAEIDGEEVDPWTSWTWMARRPIQKNEWDWLRAQSPLLPKTIPPQKRSRS